MGTDWGDVPSWIASVFTVAAVIIALWQSIHARRESAQALRLATEQREDEQAGQARLVTSEVAPALSGFTVKITNHSDAPIFGLSIRQVTCSPDPVRFGFSDKQRHEWPRLDPHASVTTSGEFFHAERET